MPDNVHVLVLAAGASTRLGQPKQLVQINGRPALHIALSNAVSVAANAVTVVIGANAGALTYLLSHSPASSIVNRAWEEGIASSIRIGLSVVPSSADAVMIVLGDQVCVTSDDLKRLLAAWNANETYIAAATYERAVGVPAIFPRWALAELAQLRGDEGARKILQRNLDRVVRVPMSNAGFDLDTPEDLAAINKRLHNEE